MLTNDCLVTSVEELSNAGVLEFENDRIGFTSSFFNTRSYIGANEMTIHHDFSIFDFCSDGI